MWGSQLGREGRDGVRRGCDGERRVERGLVALGWSSWVVYARVQRGECRCERGAREACRLNGGEGCWVC